MAWPRGQPSIAFQQPSNPGPGDVGPVPDQRIGRGRRPSCRTPVASDPGPITKRAGRTALRRPPRADLVAPARAGVRFVRVVRSAPRGSDWKGCGLLVPAGNCPSLEGPKSRIRTGSCTGCTVSISGPRLEKTGMLAARLRSTPTGDPFPRPNPVATPAATCAARIRSPHPSSSSRSIGSSSSGAASARASNFFAKSIRIS